MKLSTVLPDAGIRSEISPNQIEICGVCDHTDKIEKGWLFIAKCGAKTNPLDLLDLIESKGTAAILLEEGTTLPRKTQLPCFYAKDLALTEAALWEKYYGNPSASLRLFGVTGTNGKTSTAKFLSHLLNAASVRTGYLGTLETTLGDEAIQDEESTMTTPSARLLYKRLRALADLGAKAVVMEVSSHAIAQKRTALLRFEAVLFTNLSEDHLDYHGSMEAYFEAKRALFAQTELAIINKDDDYGVRLLATLPCQKQSVAVLEEADYTAREVYENGFEGTQYECLSTTGVLNVSYPLFGAFNVYNTLLAIAGAVYAGLSRNQIEAGLKTLKRPKGRLEKLQLPHGYTVIIDYAHTPDAMENAIKATKRITKGRLFVLFGAGGEREREKRPKMGKLATTLAYHTFITTDNPRGEPQDEIFKDILSGVCDPKSYTLIYDRTEAIKRALACLSKDDTLLLLGKGHEEYLLLGDKKLPFSERETVEAYFKEKGIL